MTRFLRFLFWTFVALHLLFGPGFIPRWIQQEMGRRAKLTVMPQEGSLEIVIDGNVGLFKPPNQKLEVVGTFVSNMPNYNYMGK